MSYQHLTTFDRARIETLKAESKLIRDIAKQLKRSPSTISRELRRNQVGDTYQSEVAHETYQTRRDNCGRIGKWSEEIAATINEK